MLFKSRGLKVIALDGRELYRVVDPKGRLDKFMQTVLDGACSAYAIVDDDVVIGTFDRKARPEQATAKPRKGLLRKLLNGLAKAFLQDYCIELEKEGKVIDDHRPLLAAMTLLMEQTIASDQAT